MNEEKKIMIEEKGNHTSCSSLPIVEREKEEDQQHQTATGESFYHLPCLMSDERNFLRSSFLSELKLSSSDSMERNECLVGGSRAERGKEVGDQHNPRVLTEGGMNPLSREDDEKENVIPFTGGKVSKSSLLNVREKEEFICGERKVQISCETGNTTDSPEGLVKRQQQQVQERGCVGASSLHVDGVYGSPEKENLRCIPLSQRTGEDRKTDGPSSPFKKEDVRMVRTERMPRVSSENKTLGGHTPQSSVQGCEVIPGDYSSKKAHHDGNLAGAEGAPPVSCDRPNTPGVHTPQPGVQSDGACDPGVSSLHSSAVNCPPVETTASHSVNDELHQDVCMTAEGSPHVPSDPPDMPPHLHTPQPGVHTPQPGVHTPQPGVHTPQPGDPSEVSCDDVEMRSAPSLNVMCQEVSRSPSPAGDTHRNKDNSTGKEQQAEESHTSRSPEDCILIEDSSDKDASPSPSDRKGDRITENSGSSVRSLPPTSTASSSNSSSTSTSTTRRTSGRIANHSNRGGPSGTSSSGASGGAGGTTRTTGRGGGGTAESRAGSTSSSNSSHSSAAAQSLSPEQEKVRQLYFPLLQETEKELHQTLSQGLPEVDTLSNPQVYLELKQHILSGPSSPSAADGGGDEDDEGGKTDSEDSSMSLLKRLLRALCEGSTLPLSSLVEAVQRVLKDDSEGHGEYSSLLQDTSADTLRSLIPVLLSRRSLGIPRRAGVGGGSAASLIISLSGAAAVSAAGNGSSSSSSSLSSSSSSPGASDVQAESSSSSSSATSQTHTSSSSSSSSSSLSTSLSSLTSWITPDKNEDTTPQCLWVWECAFLEGLPPFFKEKARKSRDKRTSISRKVKSLLRLRQCIEQGVEKEIFTAKEKVEVLRRKERQEEERRKEQALKKRRAEEARLEREREKRQKEDAKKEREKEKEKKKQVDEQSKQTTSSSLSPLSSKASQKNSEISSSSTTSTSSNSSRKSSSSSSQKDLQSMKGQQSFMASWLTRRPVGLCSGLNHSNNNRDISGGGKKSFLKRPSVGGARSSVTMGEESPGESKEGSRKGSASSGENGEQRRSDGVFDGEKDGEGVGTMREKGEGEGGEEEEREGEEDEEESRLRQEEEKAYALASYEANLWRVPFDKKEEFIQKALNLPQPLSPVPIDECTSIPFFDEEDDDGDDTGEAKEEMDACKESLSTSSCPFTKTEKEKKKEEGEGEKDPVEFLSDFIQNYARPHMNSWKEFYSFYARNRYYIHKLPSNSTSSLMVYDHGGQQNTTGGGSGIGQLSSSSSLLSPSGGAVSSGENSSSSSCYSSGSSSSCPYRLYRQEMREVRQGLILTDYAGGVNCMNLRDLSYLRTAWLYLDDWKRPVRRLLLGKQAKKSSACEPWEEESCIDYDRDSDEEWFENFDVDDLDDGRDEEEEEELEGEEDKEWLVEDDEEGVKTSSGAGYFSVRFESLYDWKWTFEGEEKPNCNEVKDMYTVLTARDRHWSSIYGCIADDFGGKPFEKLEAVGCLSSSSNSRKKLTEEELCHLLKLSHGRNISKSKLLADFHKLNRHLSKADLERKFKEHIVYERRPEDKQKRWYVSSEATEAFHLKEELETILQAIRAEESQNSSSNNSNSANTTNSSNSLNSSSASHNSSNGSQGLPHEQGRKLVEGKEKDGEMSVMTSVGGKGDEGPSMNKEASTPSCVVKTARMTTNHHNLNTQSVVVSGSSGMNSTGATPSSCVTATSVLAQLLLRNSQASAAVAVAAPASKMESLENSNSGSSSSTEGLGKTMNKKDEGEGEKETGEKRCLQDHHDDFESSHRNENPYHHSNSGITFRGIDCVSSAAWVAASSAKAALDIVIRTKEEEQEGRNASSSSIFPRERNSSCLVTPSSSSSVAFHLAAAAMAASELAKEVAGSLLEEQPYDGDDSLPQVEQPQHADQRERGSGGTNSHDSKSSHGNLLHPSAVVGPAAGTFFKSPQGKEQSMVVKVENGEGEHVGSNKRETEIYLRKETKGERTDIIGTSQFIEGQGTSNESNGSTLAENDNRSYVGAVTPPKPPSIQKTNEEMTGEVHKDAMESSPVPLGKRRRSDGGEEEEEGTSTSSNNATGNSSSSPTTATTSYRSSSAGATTKRAKRGSAGQTSGQAFSSKGSLLKNTLITQYFRSVPAQPAARRASEGKSGGNHAASIPPP